ncbi:polyphosphate kinase 2 [Phenylobacterium immobile]|uniref:polyphosphate kinase 2 n=1 Tax=Phenylobacterium immobile TaxID=21 RepID=UPI000AD9056F|nr:polyphosphate kinase 2 [Phenylobacterium immobile]
MSNHPDATADYDAELIALQTALVRYQQRAIEAGDKVLVIFEGRDTAGKDGVIKRITEHLSVRNTRVVALPKPDERERSEWYFQRYVAHLPAAGELVLFNRSWYNRAGVELVMGFCTLEEHEAFLRQVAPFEAMLTQSGIKLVKFWLDISRDEQAARLKDRRTDPLKALKVSPLDAVAETKWSAYSAARDEMLRRTDNGTTPWMIVHTDKKKDARVAVMRHLLRMLDPEADTAPPDPEVLSAFDVSALSDGRLEP